MSRIINLLVKTGENNQRIDSFIHNKEKSLSRTRIKNLILKKNLKLNNQILISPSTFTPLSSLIWMAALTGRINDFFFEKMLLKAINYTRYQMIISLLNLLHKVMTGLKY